MNDESSKQRRTTKRPCATKSSLSFLLQSNDFPKSSEKWTLSSLSVHLQNKQHLEKQEVIDLLNRQIDLLQQIKSKFDQSFRSLEEACQRKHGITYILPNRKVTFETEENFSPIPFQFLAPQPAFSHAKPQTSLARSHQKRTNDSAYSEPVRPMNSSTIWNNVNRFFTVTPRVETLQKFLQPTELPDTKVPMGAHYSIAINQRLKQKYKNGNVQLRLPSLVISQNAEGTQSDIFHRLLSAFVECKPPPTPPTHPPPQEIEEDEVSQFPDNYFGTSPYSHLSIEQKITVEIKALGLIPENTGSRLTDNEVMKDIVEKTQELKEVIERNNKAKLKILQVLQSKEEMLMKREERAKQWSTISTKPEVAPRKEHKKPKKSR
ncbi:hypothetical protein GPJ56_002920 [Histomonas meleagridis]|uniref:uncharacterized protein n=1 Tax=Histomonas meleagridis TaxID=135588 RepID=UPI00355A2072|nr:hypothetical protein GPJ56_002920 [Histomonas meleagridis]KAH0800379.1 hypothetical protein GO595_006790 [Histomonas meleagridis]